MENSIISLIGPEDMDRQLAERIKDLRLEQQYTRKTLASRAGVTEASLRRFETTGKASLELVLKVAHALGRLNEFETLFTPPKATTMAELEKMSVSPKRKRGSK